MTISKVKSRTRQQFICLWKAYQMFLFRNCHTVLARFQCHTSQCTFIYSLTHTHIPVHTSTQSYFLQFTCFALLTFILSKCVCMGINIFSQHTYLHSTLSFFFFFFCFETITITCATQNPVAWFQIQECAYGCI